MLYTYDALFEPAEEGGVVITFPDLPFGVTQSEDEKEGMEMAVDCIETVLGDLIKKGESLPVAKRRRGKNYRAIKLPALSEAKTELYRQFLASGVRKSELARRLGISKTNVDRLFDFKHSSRLELLDAAFAALGKRLIIGVDAAA
jgi:antitoxin HicB